jgi:hypothetical protein
MPEHERTVTLSGPGLAGSYIVAEERDDGSLLLRPGPVEEVVAEFADRALTEDEQEEMFRRLDRAAGPDRGSV